MVPLSLSVCLCSSPFLFSYFFSSDKQIKDAKNYLKTMGLSQDRSKYNHNQVLFFVCFFLFFASKTLAKMIGGEYERSF